MADAAGARDQEFIVDALFAHFALLVMLLMRKGMVTPEELEALFNAQSAKLQAFACDPSRTAAELRSTDVFHYMLGRLRGLLEV